MEKEVNEDQKALIEKLGIKIGKKYLAKIRKLKISNN